MLIKNNHKIYGEGFLFPTGIFGKSKDKNEDKKPIKLISKNKLNYQLKKAISKSDFAKAKKLILDGADINLKCDNDWTILHESVTKNNLKMVCFLISNNVNVNVQADNGWTPLMYAVDNHYVEIVKKLLESNADVKIKDIRGLTVSKIFDFSKFKDPFNSQKIFDLLQKYL